MKKVLLFSLALCIGLAGFAQYHLSSQSAALAKKSKVAINRVSDNDQTTPADKVQNPTTSAKTITATLLGTTWYDLQTNKCVQNRIVNHGDGTISATWTMSAQNGTYSDRGTGYNYFDGTAWAAAPTARLENVRVGWPSMTVANGNEVVITHNGAGLTMCTRTKGTGAWTTSTIAHGATNNSTWPRAMGVGLASQTIHMIATNYTGSVANGILYSRTDDAGATWAVQDATPTGLDPVTDLLPTGGDSYAMDVNGSTVAIVAGDMTSDVILSKSTDGGTTFTKTVIFQHPIPMWNTNQTGVDSGTSDANGDGIYDTLTVSDGRFAVVVDNSGVVHVFFGLTHVLRDLTTAANSFSYWPLTDGLVYWNSNMATIVPGIDFYADTLLNKVGYMVDVDMDGQITFNTDGGNGVCGEEPFTGLSSMPSAGIDANGYIYCTYSSLVEHTDYGDGRGFRNIYAIGSNDGGWTWSAPTNITQDDFTECLYGSVARKVDANLHMVFQTCIEPGNSLQPSTGNIHVVQTNNIMYNATPVGSIVGNHEIKPVNNFSVSQNYPNPFNSTSVISVNIKKASNLSLEITNLMGQLIYSENAGNCALGTHQFTIDAAHLNAGVYFYTVTAGNQKVTKKMIVE